MKNKLSKEEKDILDSYENDEWGSVASSSDIASYRTIAKNTFKKINV